MFRWHAMPFWIWGRSRPMVGKLLSSWINILSTACSHLKMNHTFKSLQTCPVNMLDPIQWVWVTASYGQHTARIRPDWISCAKPAQIRSGWPGTGQTDLVPKLAGVQESAGRVLEECNWPVTSFPLSLICVLPQTAQIILCKTSMDPIWFWLCQILAKWIWSRVQESSRANSLVFSFRCWISTVMVYL